MESSKFGYWLQVTANIGILAGLILVGLQMVQSNSLVATQLISDGMDSAITRDLSVLGETPNLSMMRIMYEPEKATKEDYVIADLLYNVILKQLFRAEYLLQRGTYGGTPEGFARVNAWYFGCPYGVAFLDQLIDSGVLTSSLPKVKMMRPSPSGALIPT